MARKALTTVEAGEPTVKQGPEPQPELPRAVGEALDARRELRAACADLSTKGVTPDTTARYHSASRRNRELCDALSADEKGLVYKLFGRNAPGAKSAKGKRD